MRQRHDTTPFAAISRQNRRSYVTRSTHFAAAGGHGFGPRFHGHGFGRIAPPLRNRDFGGGRVNPDIRQRFTVGDDGTVTLDPGDRLTIEIGEDGVATVSVASPGDEVSEPTAPPTPPPAPEAPTQTPAPPSTPTEGRSRGLYGRVVERMAVASNSDGSITVRPEGDASLQIIGDPLSGAITVVEIQPEPLNVSNGRSSGRSPIVMSRAGLEGKAAPGSFARKRAGKRPP